MRSSIAGLCLLLAGVQWACAPPVQLEHNAPSEDSTVLRDVERLSQQKWRWMAERNVDSLSALFHEDAVFVHMGGTMTKDQELGVIRSGAIQYRNAEVQASSVRVIDTTAVVLNTIRLTAVVGGNEVVNPFEVTEVYVRQDGAWRLAVLSFTRLQR